jgi:ATP-dependent RNA helicase DDX18/HAS1
LKDVYDINKLDLAKICKAFGLSSPPYVNLNIGYITSSQKRRKLNDKAQIYSKVN